MWELPPTEFQVISIIHFDSYHTNCLYNINKITPYFPLRSSFFLCFSGDVIFSVFPSKSIFFLLNT